MERLVDDLLLIARTGAGGSTSDHWTALDLDDIVFDEARRVPSTMHIDLAGVSAGQVNGDADQLRRVVRNLLDNALRHATHTVEVELDSRRRTGRASPSTTTDPASHRRIASGSSSDSFGSTSRGTDPTAASGSDSRSSRS